jgi:adenylylsulfate kinase
MSTEWYNNSSPAVTPTPVALPAGQFTPLVIWLTGLSGSGKTTLAEIVCSRLQSLSLPVRHLDGDKIRALTPNLGYTEQERIDHIKNVGNVAGRLERDGSIVVVSLISPYREARRYAREQCQNFIEVYVSTPFFECARRDAKGLYKRAFAGEIQDFTGVSAPYEPPIRPNLAIDTLGAQPESCAQLILNYVRPHVGRNGSPLNPPTSAFPA